jgi:hypothetical protein
MDPLAQGLKTLNISSSRRSIVQIISWYTDPRENILEVSVHDIAVHIDVVLV